jgi:cell wall-associated NlpC family hydrolase
MSRAGTVLLLALALATAGCASSGAIPQPFPTPGGVKTPPRVTAPSPLPAPAAPADTYAIVGTALSLRGAPYRNGGSDPSGFDCSGFVWYVFNQHGIPLPRTVNEQFHRGLDVGQNTLEAGDLVFFETESRGPSHVGLVVGGDEFVHAPSSRGDVRVERISSRYWSARYVGARRVR